MVNPRNWSIFPQHRAEITPLYCTECFKYRAPLWLLRYSRPPVTTHHYVVTGCQREQVRHMALARLLKVCSEHSLHTGCFACHDALNVSFSSFRGEYSFLAAVKLDLREVAAALIHRDYSLAHQGLWRLPQTPQPRHAQGCRSRQPWQEKKKQSSWVHVAGFCG